ncbi:MAG TPA: Gfo/Idh/MocA family oxidoreductase [Bryobacteraceae bacterium]|nr:Gfo/Idh/MocA family oxidoreductase [Bryobacteraceae bacterium]
MKQDLSRRSFVTTSAVAAVSAAPAVLGAQGTGNRLRIGWIATGSRGRHVMNQMYLSSKELVDVVAVCDTYKGNLNLGKDIVQTQQKSTPKTYVDYREVLADPNVDVVFICSPEHLHHPMAMAALKAKKHIYLEKPIGHTIEEGEEIVNTAEKTNLVVQVGTQNRSNKLYIRAKEMVEQGLIGEIHYVRAFWYRNFDPQADPKTQVPAAWRYVIPADVSPENTDWKRFLEAAEHKNLPFDKHRYFQWRNYWDYSGGISTDLLVHQTDISNFVVGKTVPNTCVASGGVYQWDKRFNDDREVPDTLSALYEYPGQFHLNYSCFFGNDQYGYGEQFMGQKGTIEVMDRQNLHFYSQPKFIRGAKPFSNHPGEVHLNYLKDFNQPDSTADHVRNFVDAVLGKAKAIAPARAGQVAAIPGHMATVSYRNGSRRVTWDDKGRKLRVG